MTFSWRHMFTLAAVSGAQRGNVVAFANSVCGPSAWLKRTSTREIPKSGDALRLAHLALIPCLASYNLCPVRPVWATTGNQGYYSCYSPVAHGPRNTRPEKAGSFLSVILRQTIIGGHGNRCQLYPKLASLCRIRATLNRYRSGLYRPFFADEKPTPAWLW